MQLNELKKYVNEVLQESTLSRLHEHISKHDCAIVTSFRDNPYDDSKCGCHDDKSPAPASYQKAAQITLNVEKKEGIMKINKFNNRDLKAKLLSYGYGVTSVEGSYIEDFGSALAKLPKREDSLFVVNIDNVDKDLFNSSIIELGKYYCQDSVLIIPKGGKDVYLYGTNNSSFPGCENPIIVGDIKYGQEAEFMTKIRDRPMTTKMNESLETYKNLSRLEKMAVRAIANKK